MTRKKSITDIGDLYASMYSNKVVEEQATQEIVEEKAKKFPKGTFPQAGKEVKTSKAFNEAGPNKVKGVTKAKKNKKNSRKKVRESINSFMKSKFDKLFENVMDDELDVNMDLGPGAGPEDSGADEVDMEMDTEMGGDEVTVTLDKETAQKLIDVLQAAVGGEEEFGGEEDSDLEDLEIDTDSEDETSEDEDEEEVDEDEDEEEKEDEAYEATEIEKLADSTGHKLTSKDNKVTGTLSSASKGKASSDVTDEVGTSTLGDKGSHLTKPGNNKVGNLKQGGSLFSK
jgi:hypothetical protein